ncbi:PleD family two-component system response regulator [Oricola cellulosilytica]|uniref:diguanylate cyclase n=1 Tax=Oricola cellulosilytica TaxID=1429082 RepID=A0A4R0PB48_9HYPH|nr:PleD family two-component system response regulator [Oricola cellulosilytica]TCD14471.1 PleD family two-component system response regulator [Oricola cellulosilytica]
MTARILVVDDIEANRSLLQTRLTAEYFDVLTAENGQQALDRCAETSVDLVLLDIMMPGIDGFEVCARLKANAATSHIPVVIVTALDEMADRVRGLEAGADDFLTKPVNEMQLLTRVRSLLRLKMLTDELRLRAVTARDIGLEELFRSGGENAFDRPQVLVIDDRKASFDKLATTLRSHVALSHADAPQKGVLQAAEGNYDCIFVAAKFANFDSLRVCSQLRSLDRTRFAPIILVADAEDETLIGRALDLGVNDYIVRPVDPNELIARLRTQVRRKRYHDGLRDDVAASIEMAVTDGLTGLHNRRYLDTHLETLVARAESRGKQLSLLITDLDRFKAINDAHGHDAGDDVLREFARRLRINVRGMDLACRYGGEEFVIVMPDTPPDVAEEVAERLRTQIEADRFRIGNGEQMIDLTISVGVTSLRHAQGQDGKTLLKRADEALYEAKSAGRNRVVSKAA